jgi:hypothetical protein
MGTSAAASHCCCAGLTAALVDAVGRDYGQVSREVATRADNGNWHAAQVLAWFLAARGDVTASSPAPTTATSMQRGSWPGWQNLLVDSTSRVTAQRRESIDTELIELASEMGRGRR